MPRLRSADEQHLSPGEVWAGPPGEGGPRAGGGTLSIRELKEGLQWERWGRKGDAAGKAGWGQTTWGQIRPASGFALDPNSRGSFPRVSSWGWQG